MPISECELIRLLVVVDRVDVDAAVESPMCVEQRELRPHELEQVSHLSQIVED